jgi:hypothetical protein
MTRVYLILSIAGWTWCAIAAAYLFFALRRTK